MYYAVHKALWSDLYAFPTPTLRAEFLKEANKRDDQLLEEIYNELELNEVQRDYANKIHVPAWCQISAPRSRKKSIYVRLFRIYTKEEGLEILDNIYNNT
jgi:hypothetical protein